MKSSKTNTIEWLCSAPARNMADLEQSNLASVRLRTAVGIKAALASGQKNILSDGRCVDAVRLAVVGKLDFITDPTRATRWLDRLRLLKSTETKIIVDYTDHHMVTQSPAAAFYRDAIALADTIVTSSHKMCDHILTSVGRHTVMIDDPIEVPVVNPTTRNKAIKTALWFGHATNLPYLLDFLMTRYTSKKERRLIIMTNQYPLPGEYVRQLDKPHLKNLEINVIPWSTADMIRAATLADICLIPAGMKDPRKSGASSNRLLTALALGLPTAADMLSSYEPFSPYFSDLGTSDLDTLFDAPENSYNRVTEAQVLITREHTIEASIMRWRYLITKDGVKNA
jgi:hypothetical protein